MNRGMSISQTTRPFVSLSRAATALGLPAPWLREEARAGRVPHLRIGRRLLFSPSAVEESLLQRAARQVEGDEASTEAVAVQG